MGCSPEGVKIAQTLAIEEAEGWSEKGVSLWEHRGGCSSQQVNQGRLPGRGGLAAEIHRTARAQCGGVEGRGECQGTGMGEWLCQGLGVALGRSERLMGGGEPS